MLEILVGIIKDVFNDPTTIEQARFSDNFFSRTRKIKNFEFLIYCFTHPICSIAVHIARFFSNKSVKDVPSKQAISKKRSQISELPFKKAFQACVEYLYEKTRRCQLSTKYGYFLVAIDGMDVTLPNSPELVEVFGAAGRGAQCAQARSSIAYDILNEISMDALMVPLSVDERALAKSHVHSVMKMLDGEKVLFIFDRGYPSYDLFQQIEQEGATFLMRVRKGFNTDIDDAPMSGGIVKIGDIILKVAKFYLPSGEVETLVTNDLSIDDEDMFELYGLRWDTEGNNKTVKSDLFLESFNGHLPQVILQEFFIVMLQNLLLRACGLEMNAEIDQKEDNQHYYKINLKTMAGLLRELWLTLFTEEDEKEKRRCLERFFFLAKRDRSAVRPGRKFSRRHPSKRRFHQNYKMN